MNLIDFPYVNDNTSKIFFKILLTITHIFYIIKKKTMSSTFFNISLERKSSFKKYHHFSFIIPFEYCNIYIKRPMDILLGVVWQPIVIKIVFHLTRKKFLKINHPSKFQKEVKWNPRIKATAWAWISVQIQSGL